MGKGRPAPIAAAAEAVEVGNPSTGPPRSTRPRTGPSRQASPRLSSFGPDDPR